MVSAHPGQIDFSCPVIMNVFISFLEYSSPQTQHVQSLSSETVFLVGQLRSCRVTACPLLFRYPFTITCFRPSLHFAMFYLLIFFYINMRHSFVIESPSLGTWTYAIRAFFCWIRYDLGCYRLLSLHRFRHLAYHR